MTKAWVLAPWIGRSSNKGIGSTSQNPSADFVPDLLRSLAFLQIHKDISDKETDGRTETAPDSAKT
jgi:hypothetical protein